MRGKKENRSMVQKTNKQKKQQTKQTKIIYHQVSKKLESCISCGCLKWFHRVCGELLVKL